MASLPNSPAEHLQADALDDFVLIRTDQVDRGERLRKIDPIWAEALGQVMLREGQRTPIEVCRLPGSTRWTLVSGGHRHAGAELVGIPELRAEIVSAGRDDRRLREVSENLWRRDLDPLDRATFVAEAVAIHKRRAGIDPASDGRVGSAIVRWQKAVKEEAADATVTMTGAYGFTEAVAAELRLSTSSVERDLFLYRGLRPSVVDRLRAARHPLLGNAAQLRALAKLEPTRQTEVVDYLTVPSASRGHPQPAKVADAIALADHFAGTAKPKPDAETKRFNTAIGTFERMSMRERVALLQSTVFYELLPAEAKRLLSPMLREADDAK